ncbi:MAG: winged helix DNA-binding domain-containing protein, partial [Acidobacteriota bacterium]|nr:winged helix DNA-binding domain-containing protein [Acidobacteriota bacterium]
VEMSLPIVMAESARLLLMDAQGLLSDPCRQATPSALQKLIEQMGFVQLDSINVVERAHHLTLASRLDDYKHEHFAWLLEQERSLFEHWTHDASVIPTKWFAHWKPRFNRERERILNSLWWKERIGGEPDKIIDHVRERIAREGPLRSQDFEHDRRGTSSAWWSWKPQKAALEFLWSAGELMVTRREKFQKVYDLTERVLPEQSNAPQPSEGEHAEWACRTALERLVVATPKEMAEFWNAISIVQAKAWCEAAVQVGLTTPVLVESLDGSKPKPSFAIIDWEQRLRGLPDVPARTRLLSPFDPVLRDRVRARRLFNFDYRFEAFVPEPKRQYGYYVLPILEGDRLVGRLDAKFHRRECLLNVRRIYWEPGIRVTLSRRRELEKAVARLARLIGAHQITLPRLLSSGS